MHTVASARSWALKELRKTHRGSPVLEADLLLGQVLGWDRVRILSHPEQSFGEDAWIRFRALVTRRVKGEPLQYLTGEKEFYGLVFRVTPAVLIPRPETETLVEQAVKLIRSRFPERARLADVGTGSGCIAISVAHEIPSSVCWAVDISAKALRVAYENAVRNQVGERILWIQSDLLDCFPLKPCFDLILCNPPYVAIEEYDSLPPEVRDHEPYDALFGGRSGLEVYRRLVPEASSLLASEGFLLLELGAGQAEPVTRLVEREGFFVENIERDLQGIPRCLVGRKARRSKENNG